MKLHALAKRLKKTPSPTAEGEYLAVLSEAATAITGAVPGEPAHDAIVHPRRGRPAKGENRASVLTAIRLPAAVAAAAKQKAKREHRSMHAAMRDAVSAWALA